MDELKENSLTPEQIKVQDIQALTGMPGWTYICQDFKALRDQFELCIHDIELPDTPTHSKKSMYIAISNCLQSFIEKPGNLMSELTPMITKR